MKFLEGKKYKNIAKFVFPDILPSGLPGVDAADIQHVIGYLEGNTKMPSVCLERLNFLGRSVCRCGAKSAGGPEKRSRFSAYHSFVQREGNAGNPVFLWKGLFFTARLLQKNIFHFAIHYGFKGFCINRAYLFWALAFDYNLKNCGSVINADAFCKGAAEFFPAGWFASSFWAVVDNVVDNEGVVVQNFKPGGRIQRVLQFAPARETA